MKTSLGTIVLYARDMGKTAAFYSEHFGFQTSGEVSEGLMAPLISNVRPLGERSAILDPTSFEPPGQV